MPTRRATRYKRKRGDEDYEECHIEDGDAGTLAKTSARTLWSFSNHSDGFLILPGRPAVKPKLDTLKARPITITKRQEKKQERATVNKYSDLSIPALREILRPLSVRGMGRMRKNELLQTCLLFDSELSAAPKNADTAVPNSRTDKNQKSNVVSTHNPVASGSRSRRSSATHHHSTLETLTEGKSFIYGIYLSRKLRVELFPLITKDHQSEIENDTEIFTTPEAQVLTNDSGRDQGKRKNDDAPSLIVGAGKDQPIVLPSREKGTALPRPRPTDLSGGAKGKQRQESLSSEEDWCPDASEDGNSAGSSSMELDEEDESVELSGMSFGEDEEDISMSVSRVSRKEDENGDGGARAAISRILEAREKDQDNPSGSAVPSTSRGTNNASGHNDVQDLRQTVNDLTQLVLQLVSSNPPAQLASKPKIKKPTGSTFRARIRSHMRTLMGLKENDDIPPSATPGQQSTWKIYTSRKDMLLPCRLDREMASNLTFSSSDPRFPFKGGPGGENSNPQILLVMWTMMKRVGVFSFRPIWEEGMNSPANKFLFSLASAIFIHLVKAGEYDDINSQDAKFDPVCAALKEHARCSLKRLFRQTNEWSQAKIRAHKQQGVRASRLKSVSTALSWEDLKLLYSKLNIIIYI
ncbi:hypothetical protein DFH28DRAFT_887877 [Melampsora americana]|nr:hypothetical protein DFH28DRAFT_887877 [Melampsora americana]